jgi:hypothetical protein
MLLKYGEKYINVVTETYQFGTINQYELTAEPKDIWEIEYIDDRKIRGYLYTTLPNETTTWLINDYNFNYYIISYFITSEKRKAQIYNIPKLYKGYSPMQSKELRDLYGGQLDETTLLYLEDEPYNYVLK